MIFSRWYWYNHGKPQTYGERDIDYNDNWDTAKVEDKFDFLLKCIEELQEHSVKKEI